MIGGVGNIGKITELRQRILFTFALLAVYRIGAFIVTPGIDPEVVRRFFEQMQGTVFGLFSLFSGGALEQLSIFSLGIMPYISASIILQLLTIVVPALENLKKEGEQGRKRINQYTRYGCMILALIQSYFIATWLEGLGRGGGGLGFTGSEVVANPGWGFRLITMISLTTGTAFIMWLGEQITERGIGNGISLIIFAGIVAGMWDALTQLLGTGDFDLFNFLYLFILVPSAMWMPLTFRMLEAPNPGLWLAIRVVLGIVGIASVLLIAGLLLLNRREPAWAYGLAILGSVAFAVQTALLDAIVWPAYFPV